jgi:hypothetical protein
MIYLSNHEPVAQAATGWPGSQAHRGTDTASHNVVEVIPQM